MAGTAPEVYDGLIAILPLGKAGQVAWENRLLQSPFELLDAQGVTLEDRYVRKEAGVSNFDANGVATAPAFAGSLSVANQWSGHLMSFKGVGATAHVKSVGSATGSTSANPGSIVLTITVAGSTCPAGNLVVVCASCSEDDIGATDAIVDTRGNVWTREFHDSNNQFMTVWWSLLTTTLQIGDTIQVTFANLNGSDVTTKAAAVADEFTGLQASPFENEASLSGQFGTSLAVGPLPTSTSQPLLLIQSVANFQDSGPVTFTASAGFTKRTEANTGNTINDVAAHIASRVDTTSPIIVAIHDWWSGVRILSGGTFKATTTAGSTTVTGTGSTLWKTGTEAQRIFAGDEILVYTANDMERRTVQTVTNDTTLTTTEPWVTAFAAQDYVVIRRSRLLTATTGGNIFKEREGDLDAVTLKANLSKVGRPGKFIQCGKEDGNLQRKVIYVNGYNLPQVLVDDGATTSDIATPSPDWDSTVTNAGARPANGCVHRDRTVLICPRGKDPHRLYMSSPTNHGDFGTTNGTTRRIRSDIGDELWGLASFQGVLWAWKYPVGVFYIDDSDLDPLNWIERTKSQAVGCAPSPFSVCPMDDDVIFMTPTAAFHLLSAVDTLGGVRASDLSWRLGLNKWLSANVNLGRLNQVLSVWYPDHKVALFSVPATGSTVNNLLLKWDFSGVEDEDPPKFSYSFQNTPDALALKRDTDGVWKPVIGEGPFVKLLERTARNKEGAAYTGRVQTPHLNFSHVDPSLEFRRKLYEHLELVMEPAGTSTLTVEVYVDGALRQTLTFDGNLRRHRRKLNVGDGHTISVKITNSALNQDFKLLAALVYFKAGNNDQSR